MNNPNIVLEKGGYMNTKCYTLVGVAVCITLTGCEALDALAGGSAGSQRACRQRIVRRTGAPLKGT